MPYVKISDPNIIDLSAWHQVVNVVNQHSDSINNLTNNFGVQGSGVVDWNGASDIVHEYSLGPQKILYGRKDIQTSGTSKASNINNDQIFYGEIEFADGTSGTTAFSSRPIVTASIQFGHSDINLLDDKNHNIVFNLWGVTESKFGFRVTRATSTEAVPSPLTGHFYLNWTAIGPK